MSYTLKRTQEIFDHIESCLEEQSEVQKLARVDRAERNNVPFVMDPCLLRVDMFGGRGTRCAQRHPSHIDALPFIDEIVQRPRPFHGRNMLQSLMFEDD